MSAPKCHAIPPEQIERKIRLFGGDVLNCFLVRRLSMENFLLNAKTSFCACWVCFLGLCWVWVVFCGGVCLVFGCVLGLGCWLVVGSSKTHPTGAELNCFLVLRLSMGGVLCFGLVFRILDFSPVI